MAIVTIQSINEDNIESVNSNEGLFSSETNADVSCLLIIYLAY